MLRQYLGHILADPFLFWCSIVMLTLAIVDLGGSVAQMLGLNRIKHVDFKTTIVSIGLFATFYGVLIGLYGFDPKDIAGSVPKLLEGLRFAFGASVLGMFLSVSLSILHKFAGEEENDDEILRSIDRKIGDLTATIESPQAFVSEFSEMKSFLAEHMEKINSSLDQALVQLARGATQEVTEALERIIIEFNDNLKSQFGENFKELNAACHKLVSWQERYKTHIDSAEKNLKTILVSLDESCAAVKELSEKNHETQEVCKQVGDLINTYDVQVRTLATHLESCKKLGDQAGQFLTSTGAALTTSSENLNAFSSTIEKTVSKQSESLAQLTQDINEQLPKALGELEKVLTGITNQFASDYRSLFQFITDKR